MQEFAAAIESTILELGPDIEPLWRRLRAGRAYTGGCRRPAGRLLTRTNRDGVEHPYIVRVPDSYDPAMRRYPLVVYLHGGVARPKRETTGAGGAGKNGLANEDDAIVVAPLSWSESLWWQSSQAREPDGRSCTT